MKPNTLLTTNNYNMFKLTDYNRNVDLQHVQQLVNELKAGRKFLQPIVVNEKLEIIDGQHRLKALQEVKQPVEYIVRPGAGKADVISMNNTQKNWSPEAWIQSYANAGNRDYQALLQVVDKQRQLQISANMLAKIFEDPYATSTLSKEPLKKGKFKFDYENAPHADKVINDAISLTEGYQKGRKRSLVRAILEPIWILESNPEFNFEHLFNKMTEDDFKKAAGKASSVDAALEMLDVYNYRLRKGKILAHKDAHGRLVFE